MTCGSPKFGHRKSKMAEKQKTLKETFSPWPGDIFSYPKCYHSSKSRRNILGQILVSRSHKGGRTWPRHPLKLHDVSLWNHIYISCSDNSWLRFWCQKSSNPFSQISNGRISASFYRLASFEMYVRHLLQVFQKTEKFLSFLVYLNQKWQK